MLVKENWVKIKKKLVKLPAKRRLRELKVLLVQTTDKRILKEINELLEKVTIELQKLPWREKYGTFTLGSRLKDFSEEGAVRPRDNELEELVAEVPIPENSENIPNIDYSSIAEYDQGGYFSKKYNNSSDNLYSSEDTKITTAQEEIEALNSKNKKYEIA